MKTEIPRSAKMYEWEKAEKAIYDAMQEVEAMPADTRLTDAVILLADAQKKVAEFIDSKEGEEWLASKLKS